MYIIPSKYKIKYLNFKKDQRSTEWDKVEPKCAEKTETANPFRNARTDNTDVDSVRFLYV